MPQERVLECTELIPYILAVLHPQPANNSKIVGSFRANEAHASKDFWPTSSMVPRPLKLLLIASAKCPPGSYPVVFYKVIPSSIGGLGMEPP
ncbi:hypothetical protein BX600DRAFT_465330 [Xylariales sp. PMI_506]|nr:hypothetical protein BX600DRAFT_465330 [Xylariales sp. PMI_506]